MQAGLFRYNSNKLKSEVPPPISMTNGPDKGMPNWKGILQDETLWTIFTFLESVQSQP